MSTTSSPASSGKGKRWLAVLLWLIILGSPAAAGYVIWSDSGTEADNWLIEPLAYGDIEESVAATGTLEPKNYVEVGAQVSGQVKRLLIEEGDVVTKGQLLAEIDASVFELNVQTAEASLDNKRAQLAQQEAQLDLDEMRLKRNENLYTRKAISLDTLVASRTEVKILKAKIDALLATIKADEASLQADKVSLGYTRIVAPIDGTVASIAVREGQTLNATNSAPTVLQISDLSVMTLRAEVSEADVPRLSRGMDVKFATLGKPKDYRWSTLRQILPTPNVVNDVVLYQVLVDVENSDGGLMDSMSTKVFFVESHAEDVLVAPVAAVVSTPRGSFAKVAVNGQRERMPVETGVRSRTHVEIVSGLQEGAQLIAGSKQKTSDGETQARSMTGGNERPPGFGGGKRRD